MMNSLFTESPVSFVLLPTKTSTAQFLTGIQLLHFDSNGKEQQNGQICSY